MDIYVMPSLTETTGLSTVEAMSSGIPVITTPVGIAMTGISSGYNGMIFSKGNDAELEAQLETLLPAGQRGRSSRKTPGNPCWTTTPGTRPQRRLRKYLAISESHQKAL
jgi:glycosyltransferase involved in cell wall biosynthesis